MAEVMSMISDENSQGELNADEQESLQIGEEMEQQQDTMLAGKYKNAEELEAAYIELQKKLGGQDQGTPTEETTEETPEEEETLTDSSLFERLWEESQDEFSEDTLKELSEAKPEDLAKMYLEYRKGNQRPALSEKDASQLRGLVGGDAQYKSMMEWAADNLEEQEISMYDSVMENGDPSSAFFAVQALALRMREGVGVEGKLIQGKAPSNKSKGFKSQAEVVSAMQDPRYDRDPAYRQEVMAKLESSNVNF